MKSAEGDGDITETEALISAQPSAPPRSPDPSCEDGVEDPVWGGRSGSEARSRDCGREGGREEKNREEKRRRGRGHVERVSSWRVRKGTGPVTRALPLCHSRGSAGSLGAEQVPSPSFQMRKLRHGRSRASAKLPQPGSHSGTRTHGGEQGPQGPMGARASARTHPAPRQQDLGCRTGDACHSTAGPGRDPQIGPRT